MCPAPVPPCALLLATHIPSWPLTWHFFPSLPAATLAGRLCSGHANSGSREESKGRAAQRLERCEVRKVGRVGG